MEIIEEHQDYVITEDIMVDGEVINIIPPSEFDLQLTESVKIGNERARAWAKKFCKQNAELLKRLADR